MTSEDFVEFNGSIYVGVDNEDTGAEVWRSSDGGTWSRVGDGGFGDPDNAYLWDLESSQTELYASVSTSSPPNVARIFGYTAEVGWSQIGPDGLGDSNNTAAFLYSWNSLLLAFTFNVYSGSEIWAWNGTAWSQCMSDGIDGNPGNIVSFPLGEFKGHLYMTTLNWVNGTGLWRTIDGVNWMMANEYGFGNENNTYVSDMIEYKGYLYAVTSNVGSGAEVWRSSDGLSWSKVRDGGFGDRFNYLGRTVVFKEYLYVTTFNWNYSGDTPATGAEVWRSSDGLSWSQVNNDGFGDPYNRRGYPVIGGGNIYVVTANTETGVEVWRSSDGLSWSQVNTDGFGDPNNGYAWVRFVFKDHLYVATMNEATGTEVWRLDEALTPPPDFSMGVSPSSVTVQSRSSASLTLTISSINGFNSPVRLNYSWLGPEPADVSVSIPESVTPPPDSNASASIGIAAGPASTNGTYTLRLTGLDGGLQRHVDVQVEVTPWTGGCLIATAAYGSEVSPEVQFLREFRDERVLKTFVGFNSMKTFNVWYYSFSPAVSRFIAGSEWARTLTRIMLYPLLAVLHLSEKGYSAVQSLSPEVAFVVSEFIASALLGLMYLAAPTVLVLGRVGSKGKRIGKSIVGSLFTVWILSIILLVLSELSGAALLCSLGSVAFVLSTISMAGIGVGVWIMDYRSTGKG
ncbi:MAG: CFI-box-CTERM domain-containing protein [Candidatus Bathyarchaeia archaeon]